MKRIAAVALVVALSCNSLSALAEGPVPFKALMRNDGTQPALPLLADADGQAAPSSTQSAHKTHMTRAGKIMTGVGIGLAAIGGLVIAVTPNTFSTSTDKAELYGAGGATMGVGAILIVVGVTRHSAQ